MIKTLLLNEADPANLETLLVDDAERADRESTGSSRAQGQSNKTTSNRVPGTGIFLIFHQKLCGARTIMKKMVFLLQKIILISN